jgi:hypothetical protein
VRQAKVYAKDHDIGNLTIFPTELNDLEKVAEIMTVGAKAKTPPFARGLRRSRWSDRDKAGRDTLRSIRHFDEGLQRRLPAARPRSVLRPTCDLAHCNGPCVAAFVLRA